MYANENKKRYRRPTRRADAPSGDFVVGIDTGGTYTDGVLMDYHSRGVITAAKTLTTRDDLSRGVITVLKKLNIEDPAKIKLVGISSTLSTNSVAEGKAREVGLILIGYDADLIASYGLDQNFNTPHVAYFQGGHTSQGNEKAPMDVSGVRQWVEEKKDTVDAFAVSSYFSPLNPEHEEAAVRLIRDVCDLPVVLGHQLSTQIDSVKRASTACLNASLVAVMQEFIDAVQAALADRRITAPLMIVKGDGSLMPHSEAAEKPVETILSGPSASAMGGLFFSRTGNALMIDVGGTTTDMALLKDSRMIISDKGARVGNIETAVKAAQIRTICVGCDSRLAFDQWGKTTVGPDRVVPLSRLASRYPDVREEVLNLDNKSPQSWVHNDIIYWFLHAPVTDIEDNYKDPKQQQLLKLLNAGPKSVSALLAAMNVYHTVQLNAEPLLRQGVIEVATLTPTDLLHVNGKLDKWDADAARRAVACACVIQQKDKKTFVEECLELIVTTMIKETMIFLARQSGEDTLPENLDGKWADWLFQEAVGGRSGTLSINIASRFPIIGIGAPAGIFIKKVAEALKAPFILPEHAHVANAAGAVAGSIISEKEALLYVRERTDAFTYIVQIGDTQTHFTEHADALKYARRQVSGVAKARAAAAGAVSPQVDVSTQVEGSMERIRARAVGNPVLSGEWAEAAADNG